MIKRFHHVWHQALDNNQIAGIRRITKSATALRRKWLRAFGDPLRRSLKEITPNRYAKAFCGNRGIKEDSRARKRQLRDSMERRMPVLRLRRT